MITRDEVIEVLKELPQDETNPGCVYVSDEGKHCIAGEVMYRLGVLPPNDILFSIQCEGSTLLWNDTGFDRFATGLGIPIEDDAIRLLCLAQEIADDIDDEHATTWGEAIEGALDFEMINKLS